jgi:hypothetical protein
MTSSTLTPPPQEASIQQRRRLVPGYRTMLRISSPSGTTPFSFLFFWGGGPQRRPRRRNTTPLCGLLYNRSYSPPWALALNPSRSTSTERPKYKMTQYKTFQPQKRPNLKNIPNTKHPKPQKVPTVEVSATRGTTALVYCLINSSLYTGTVQGWWSTSQLVRRSVGM